MMRYFVFKSGSHGISEIRLHEATCTVENLGMHIQVNVAIICMVQIQGLIVTKFNLNSNLFLWITFY